MTLSAAVALLTTAAMPGAFAESSVFGKPGVESEFNYVIEVTSQAHASGEYTIQDAFNDLPESGGIVKLGEGKFELAAAATPPGVPIRIVGQGTSATTITGRIALILNPAPHTEVTDLSFTGLRRGVALTDDGGYGHVKFHNVHFNDIDGTSIDGNVGGPIGRLTITQCRFENVHSGATFRTTRSRNLKVSDNEFFNITTRPIVLGIGKGRGDNRYAEITNNHIDGVGPGRHPIGILTYVEDTLIEGNIIKNIHNDARHEGISSRGRNTIIRNNTIIDAGGSTAAISLAGPGPTLIENNVIRFTGDHKGRRDGIDIRQTQVTISGNRLIGTDLGIHFRRGGLATVENNFIGDSSHQRQAITVTISTGDIIPAEAMRDVIIRNNRIAEIRTDEGGFHAIRFHIDRHRGDHEARMDDIVISNNTFTDIDAVDAHGIYFSNVSERHSPIKGVLIAGNDFTGLASPIHSSHQYVEDLRISNNLGYQDE